MDASSADAASEAETMPECAHLNFLDHAVDIGLGQLLDGVGAHNVAEVYDVHACKPGATRVRNGQLQDATGLWSA